MAQQLCKYKDPLALTTPITAGGLFPEILQRSYDKYGKNIAEFGRLVSATASSEDLLRSIRGTKMNKDDRMSLLKLFRRCVSLPCDTEMTKKVQKISTDSIITALGSTFKNIKLLKQQFSKLTESEKQSLAALMGEYDLRGLLGYELTGRFFPWFTKKFPAFELVGPIGAGKDIELSKVIKGLDTKEKFPCDFVAFKDGQVKMIGFARYDSSRGGAQSDDRTGGNSNKVDKAIKIAKKHKIDFRMLFLADGPGLAHTDTWEEACRLDGQWGGRVRVSTLKILDDHVTEAWLLGNEK